MGMGRNIVRALGLAPVAPIQEAVDLAASVDVVHVLTGDLEQAKGLPRDVQASFGLNFVSDTVTREAALAIPAVSRGRDVICGTIASLPIRVVGKSGATVERSLFKQLNPNVPNSNVIAITLDDMLFFGKAWWRVLARDADGFPSFIERVAGDRVTWNGTETILVDGVNVPARDMIRFDSPNHPLLDRARTLRTAILLEDAVRRYARLDVPLGFLTDAEGGMDEDEIQDFLDEWEVNRQTRTTSYLPKGLAYESAMMDAQKIELGSARAYQAADIARLMNLPASIVNAPSNDSLTYATTESNRRELVDITLKPFMTAFLQRLSLGDVTPRGLTVEFSLTRFLLGDTKTVIEAGALAIQAGIMDINEVRVDWLGLAPRGEVTP